MTNDENNLLDPEVPNETKVSDIEIDNEFNIEQPGLLDVLGAELKALAMVGLELKAKINTAKTTPKKRLYEKKLKKNSIKAAEIILYLERVQINKAIEENREQQKFIDIRKEEDGDGAATSAGDTTGGRTSEESEEA